MGGRRVLIGWWCLIRRGVGLVVRGKQEGRAREVASLLYPVFVYQIMCVYGDCGLLIP